MNNKKIKGNHPKRKLTRYNPGGGFFKNNAMTIVIILVSVCSFLLGGFSFLGVYRMINPMPEQET